MNKKLVLLLQGLGFEEKEASVYLACFELGSSSNTELSKKTGLNRITNYEILKRLQKKGIIQNHKKSGTLYFSALDPRLLIKQQKEKTRLAEDALPEMLSLCNDLEKKPKVLFYEGRNGIKNIYEDTLHSQKEILTITNPKDLSNFLGEYMQSYVKERTKKKISLRGLAPNDEYGRKAMQENPNSFRQGKLFSKEYAVNNEIMIYDTKVAIYSGTDEIGIVIDNETIANTFRNLWQMIWDKTE